jgi:hypothetical protein
MYYAMSIPELLMLAFIIFLWILSIVYFIKRYEKISTIERADMHSFNKNKKQLNSAANASINASVVVSEHHNININQNPMNGPSQAGLMTNKTSVIPANAEVSSHYASSVQRPAFMNSTTSISRYRQDF